MKVFDKRDFVRFVRSNDELYIDNVGVDSEFDNFDYDMKIVNDVVLDSGVYSLMFGSRGEVDFRKVNFVEELVEWNNIDNDYEFKFMNNYDERNYLDLGFDEEDFRCYFFILGDR